MIANKYTLSTSAANKVSAGTGTLQAQPGYVTTTATGGGLPILPLLLLAGVAVGGFIWWKRRQS